jgi:hypothetical protein
MVCTTLCWRGADSNSRFPVRRAARILLRFDGSIPDGHSPFRDRILRQIGTAVYMQGLPVTNPAFSDARNTAARAKSHYPVPISADLAERLAAPDRPANAPLVTRPNGKPWQRTNHAYPFRLVAKACGQDPAEVTMYALRHSSIVRQLLAGVPVRIVAAGHDTSVAMIERNYSRYITDHADALVRSAMLNLAPRDQPKLAVVG